MPRLFNRIYDRVLAGVKAKGGVSSYLFHTAFNAKKAHLNKTVHHWLWDRVVFGQVYFWERWMENWVSSVKHIPLKIRAKLGGRVRFILSGSAPVSPDVMDFMRICFSAKVFEGYGQTENFCGGCLVSAFCFSIVCSWFCNYDGQFRRCKTTTHPESSVSRSRVQRLSSLIVFRIWTIAPPINRTQEARSASEVTLSCENITRLQTRQPRPSTRTDGCIQATLVSLTRPTDSRSLIVARTSLNYRR